MNFLIYLLVAMLCGLLLGHMIRLVLIHFKLMDKDWYIEDYFTKRMKAKERGEK